MMTSFGRLLGVTLRAAASRPHLTCRGAGHLQRTLCYQHYCTVQRAGSSEFWKRKMVTLFELHDTDGDGRIDWTDYVRVQTRLCQTTGVGMKEEVDAMLNFRRLWEYWLGSVEDPHTAITREEFVRSLQHAINQPAYKTTEKKQMPVWAFFYKIFEMIDANGNRIISPKEYKIFFKAYGLSDEMAEKSFKAIDRNADGFLSIDEFVNVAIDFLYSEDETTIGKEFFGTLVEELPESIKELSSEA
ncbi:sarcoplasmic calcium-binding protein-like [Pollicipes pollicipes]|uniref:sarcoplasmic calcium-binding protein-like n=2 Tax=Pollicipes pollicipes TaxID=41117 RepID=UPI001884DADE|nr:sarcoplasmic calcium-binding protein-like [Pollicipes pollicipes]